MLTWPQESARPSSEVERLHALRMLQLARATRDTFAAHVRYHHLRVRELDIMRTIAADQHEQAETFFKKAEWQVGEIKHILDDEGLGLLEDVTMYNSFEQELTGGDHEMDHSESSRTSCITDLKAPH